MILSIYGRVVLSQFLFQLPRWVLIFRGLGGAVGIGSLIYYLMREEATEVGSRVDAKEPEKLDINKVRICAPLVIRHYLLRCTLLFILRVLPGYESAGVGHSAAGRR